jgi:hypothetical protein
MVQVQDAHTVIGKGMFKKETDMSIFTNLKVHFSTGMCGTHALSLSRPL